ncbi:MAG: PAS domain S-box protein, partial [Nitrospinae bacterium]|nr:PAS domain S-box protein [Nitrospinota bacterium]
FRGAFEDAATGIALTDISGKIFMVNSSLSKMLGYSENELISKSFQEISASKDIDKSVEYKKKAEKGEINSFRIEKNYIHKDGSTIYTLLQASLIRDNKGFPLYYVTQIIDLTERKTLEDELENIARFPKENPSPVMRVSTHGVILYANQPSSIILGKWDRTIGSYVAEDWTATIKDVYRDGVPYRIDKEFNDRIFTLSFVPVPGQHYVNIYAMDITERKQAEEKYLDLYNNAPDMYFSVDAKDGLVTECNITMLEKTGYTKKEIIGMHINELYASEDRELSEKVFKKFLKKGLIKNCEMRVRNKDGSLMYVSLDASAVRDKKGNILRSRSSWKDITDKKHAEVALQNANEEIKTFANIVSHDLRSPLTNIKGFSKILLNSCNKINDILAINKFNLNKKNQEQETVGKLISEEIPHCIDYINVSVETMDRLVSRVLILARIGKLKLNPVEFSMRALVEDQLKMRNHQITSGNIRVWVDDLPDITADMSAMDQILSNLLSNAINYLDKNRQGEIRISGIKRRFDTTFSIQDNGIGIPEKEAHKVFEVFRRGSNVGESMGEGMGMSYVRALIEKHGGEITFESREGKGTTFHFSIPNNIEVE